MIETIRELLAAHARLPEGAAKALGPDDDLYQAGMTSHASINLMMALEGAFEVEFPDEMLRRDVFQSIAAIQAAVEKLRGA